MPEQNYSHHTRWFPPFHFVIGPLLVAVFIGSIVNLIRSFHHPETHYSAALITTLTLCVLMMALFARLFATKAQDRAIRAEENLRHYVLTGKLLDVRLSMRQIVGLRFAPDAEFPELARRAAAEKLSPDAIKRAIGSWRADHDRL